VIWRKIKRYMLRGNKLGRDIAPLHCSTFRRVTLIFALTAGAALALARQRECFSYHFGHRPCM